MVSALCVVRLIRPADEIYNALWFSDTFPPIIPTYPKVPKRPLLILGRVYSGCGSRVSQVISTSQTHLYKEREKINDLGRSRKTVYP